jgi:ribosome-associated protein
METWEKTLTLIELALEKKAYDLVLLEVREVTSVADYFIICSGRSDRQVQSITQGIQENLAKREVFPASVEGYTRGQWVLMDFSDVVVHIFYEPVRRFYDLERLWSHAPKVNLPEPYSTWIDHFTIANEPDFTGN